MTDTHNPYTPPKASLDPRVGESLWRDGKVLVMRQGGILPPRCVQCNEPAELPLTRRKVYWHEPWVYILAIACLPLYAIVSLITRRQAIFAPGLCPVHRKRHWLGIALGWGGTMLGLVLMFLGGTHDFLLLLRVGLAVLLGAIATGLILSRILQPERIDKDLVRLKGCCQAFLNTLPPFNG